MSWPFRPTLRSDNNGYQGELYGKALGELDQQLTHELTPDPHDPDSLNQDTYSSEDILLNYDFTDTTVFGGVRLAPLSTSGSENTGRVPYSPVLVIRSKDKIIDGHNGIFQDGWREFLTKYVSFIEAKRLLLRARREIQAKENVPPPACLTTQ